jgi:hypothetical protein
VYVGDLASTMARMEALIAQRKTAAYEAEAATAKVASLDAEIRAVAAQLAGTAPPDDPQPQPVSNAHTRHRNVTNGTNGHPVVNAATLTEPPAARDAGEREHLAPRKLELLKLVSDRRGGEADLGFLAIRMYGNEGRSARVNVSTYCTDLKAEGYVEPGSRPGTWRLTPKGQAVTTEVAAT